MAVGYLAGLVYEVSQPAAPAQNQRLEAWLAARHLHTGLSGYWESGVVTLASGNRVQIRQVVVTPRGRLIPSNVESDWAWYTPAHSSASFVVLTRGLPGYPGLTSKRAVLATFGPPAQTFHFGMYAVLIWHKNLLSELPPAPARAPGSPGAPEIVDHPAASQKLAGYYLSKSPAGSGIATLRLHARPHRDTQRAPSRGAKSLTCCLCWAGRPRRRISPRSASVEVSPSRRLATPEPRRRRTAGFPLAPPVVPGHGDLAGSFLTLAVLLVVRNAYLFTTKIYEDMDFAANTIAVLGKHFDLLTGKYSKEGFYHPGPAFLYVMAGGESFFHDLLHLVPTPWNGQLLAILLLNAALIGASLAVVARHRLRRVARPPWRSCCCSSRCTR